MENLVTKELLAAAENRFLERRSSYTLNKAFRAHEQRAALQREINVFLSHKHDERELVRQAIALFSSLGVELYVDWLDTTMPPATNGTTATRLKRKIIECRKFVLLGSDAAISSKWCNWELGLGDAAKYLDHIAILPAGSRGKKWEGSEYLGIYPVITSTYEYIPRSYYVEFGERKNPLDKWLKS